MFSIVAVCSYREIIFNMLKFQCGSLSPSNLSACKSLEIRLNRGFANLSTVSLQIRQNQANIYSFIARIGGLKWGEIVRIGGLKYGFERVAEQAVARERFEESEGCF